MKFFDKKNPIKYETCLFSLDPCARINCNHGRCEVDRGVAVCQCYQGYTGHDCLTSTGKRNVLLFLLLSSSSLLILS